MNRTSFSAVVFLLWAITARADFYSSDEGTFENRWLEGHLGIFKPSDKVIQDIYGSGILFSGGAGGWFLGEFGDPTHFGGQFSLDVFYITGIPYTAGYVTNPRAELTVIPLTATGMFRAVKKGQFVPYFGAGVGLYYLEEVLNSDQVAAKTSKTGAGVHALLGLEIFKNFLFEIKYSTATIRTSSGAVKQSIDAGGLTTTIGLRFYNKKP